MKFSCSIVAITGVAILASLSRAHAVTLEQVMQTTLEKNPTIQQAKARLEEAAGRRVELRSINWADARIVLPAGVQGGSRAGESGTKGFAFVRGLLTQPLFNAAIPPSQRRGGSARAGCANRDCTAGLGADASELSRSDGAQILTAGSGRRAAHHAGSRRSRFGNWESVGAATRSKTCPTLRSCR